MLHRFLVRYSPQCRRGWLAKRHFFFGPRGWGQVRFPAMAKEMERDFDRARRDFERFFERTPFGAFGRSFEFFSRELPIVEDNGVKLMRLELDASFFRPEEISIKTTQHSLAITAQKKTGDRVDFEFTKEYEIPEGVDHKEIKCRYTEEHNLLLEAPYTGPPEKAPPKAQDIPVQHE